MKYKTEKDESTGLLRITSLIEIPLIGVKVGEKGGLIEKESNLSQTGLCWVFGDARVYEDAQVYGNARVSGNARVYGDARVYGNARVSRNARVCGNAQVYGGAWVSSPSHVITIGPIGSRNSTLTMFKTKEGASVTTGCFLGTLEEFEEAVKKKPEGDVYRLVYESSIALLRATKENFH